jgi:tRNA threonylcarbamoyladenosine biosynthesis protein TsaE
VGSEPAPAVVIDLPTRRATQRLGAALGRALAPGDVVVLEGDLGVGKTFLVRAIARALSVSPEVPVQSPTFALVHELEGRVPILHCDLYRLSDEAELRELGLLDGARARVVTLVEWGARFRAALGGEGLDVRLEHVAGGGSGRRALLRAVGARGERLLSDVARALDERPPAPARRRAPA